MNNIKKCILKSGFKNTYIAEQMGVHDTEISNWIAGRRTMTKDKVRKLAKLLKCKMTDLYPNLNNLREGKVE